MPIPKGKCQKCKSRHFCGITDLVHPDDIDKARREFGIKFEVRVIECRDYERKERR